MRVNRTDRNSWREREAKMGARFRAFARKSDERRDKALRMTPSSGCALADARSRIAHPDAAHGVPQGAPRCPRDPDAAPHSPIDERRCVLSDSRLSNGEARDALLALTSATTAALTSRAHRPRGFQGFRGVPRGPPQPGEPVPDSHDAATRWCDASAFTGAFPRNAIPIVTKLQIEYRSACQPVLLPLADPPS